MLKREITRNRFFFRIVANELTYIAYTCYLRECDCDCSFVLWPLTVRKSIRCNDINMQKGNAGNKKIVRLEKKTSSKSGRETTKGNKRIKWMCKGKEKERESRINSSEP